VESNDPGPNLEAESRLTEDPETEEEEAGYRFWPTHVLDQVIIFYLLGGVLITLAILLPFRLGAPADPLRTPEGIKPEWYFLPMYQAIKYLPKVLGIVLTGLGGLVLVIWPFLDKLFDMRSKPFAYRKLGAAAVVLALVLAGLGWVSERTITVGGQQYAVDMLGIPHRQAPGAASGETGATPPAAGPPAAGGSPPSSAGAGETGAAPPSDNSTGAGAGPAPASSTTGSDNSLAPAGGTGDSSAAPGTTSPAGSGQAGGEQLGG
jgi:hypothetical protein